MATGLNPPPNQIKIVCFSKKQRCALRNCPACALVSISSVQDCPRLLQGSRGVLASAAPKPVVCSCGSCHALSPATATREVLTGQGRVLSPSSLHSSACASMTSNNARFALHLPSLGPVFFFVVGMAETLELFVFCCVIMVGTLLLLQTIFRPMAPLVFGGWGPTLGLRGLGRPTGPLGAGLGTHPALSATVGSVRMGADALSPVANGYW